MSKLRVFKAKNKDKLADYNLSEKELHKTPAAALGEHDANRLIKEWLSQTRKNVKELSANKAQDKEAGVVTPTKSTFYLGMRNKDLKAGFTKLITDEASSESQEKAPDDSPSKRVVKISPEKTTKGDEKAKKSNNDDGNDYAVNSTTNLVAVRSLELRSDMLIHCSTTLL